MAETKNTETTDIFQLKTEFKKLNALTARQVSYWQVFFRGIISGVGTAIGATIIAGLLLAIVGEIINRSGGMEFLEDIMQQISITSD